MVVIYVSCRRLAPSPPTRADTCICSRGLPLLIGQHALPFALRHANQLPLTHYPRYESVSYRRTLAARSLFLPSLPLDQAVPYANEAVTAWPYASAGNSYGHVCSIIASHFQGASFKLFHDLQSVDFLKFSFDIEMSSLFNS